MIEYYSESKFSILEKIFYYLMLFFGVTGLVTFIGGIILIIVGIWVELFGYDIEHLVKITVALMVTALSCTVAFLLIMWLRAEGIF